MLPDVHFGMPLLNFCQSLIPSGNEYFSKDKSFSEFPFRLPIIMVSTGNFLAGVHKGSSEAVDHSGVGLLTKLLLAKQLEVIYFCSHPVVAKFTHNFVINLVTCLSSSEGIELSSSGIVLWQGKRYSKSSA